jgi:hypothetical protein
MTSRAPGWLESTGLLSILGLPTRGPRNNSIKPTRTQQTRGTSRYSFHLSRYSVATSCPSGTHRRMLFNSLIHTHLASMAAGCWSVSQVVDLINRFRESPAQVMVDGKPLVSTFEGPDWAAHWPAVRCQTGDICLIPDWSSLGPHGVGQKLDLIDGACKLTFCPWVCNSEAKGCSFLGCLAQGRSIQDDHGRRPYLQGQPPGQEVHDGC